MRLSAPTNPPDIICIGTNYRARGDQAAITDQPDRTLEVFLKPTTSLIGPNEPIPMPRFDDADVRLDCEGELAIVLAHDARHVAEADALRHILGFTIANDITARLFQTPSGPPLWMRGKGFPGFCPLGPDIVTPDEIPDPGSLRIRTLVNGRVVREGSTVHMIRGVPQVIAALSRHMLLRAGTVILTGAPPVIDESTKPASLSLGDEVAIEIDGIGRLVNRIR